MDIIQAIRTRRSIRSFRPDPVPRELLERVLDDSRWAPSSSNTQPWEMAVLGGDVLATFKQRLLAKMKQEWDPVELRFRNMNPDIPFPTPASPYKDRSLDLRKTIDSHQFPPGTIGLDEKRRNYLLYGGQLWGAPAAIILYANRAVCPKAVFDLGIVAQTIALAACNYGLGTCMMTMPVHWPEMVRDLCDIPEIYLLAAGIAIGYPHATAPVNNFERAREPLEAFSRWHGFK